MRPDTPLAPPPRQEPGCLSGCLVAAGRFTWRYRWQLAPAWLALGMQAAAMALITVWPAGPYRPIFAWVGGLTTAAAAGLWVLGARVGLDRAIERGYAALIALGCGLYVGYAYWYGSLATRTLQVWAIATMALGVPWWWHRRIRRTGRMAHSIQQWADDLTAHEPGSSVSRPQFDPGGGCAIPWDLAPGRVIDDVRPAIGRLESLLDLRPGAIEIEQDPDRKRRVILHVQPRDPHKTALDYPGPPRDATITRPVVIGRYLDGGPAQTPLLGLHALIAGTTGSGKSGVLNVVIAYLAACPDVVLWGCDLKHGLELGPWAPVFASGRIATTPEQAAGLLEGAVRVGEARGEEMARRKLRTWPTSPSMPALVVVIDEHKPLAGNKRAITAVETLTAQGRAMAVSVIDTTQYPTVPALGSSLIAPQCAVKIALRVNTPGEANVILGPGSASAGWRAHEIPKGKPGTLYLDAPDADSPRLARAYYIDDATVDRLARRYARRRPALDPFSEQAISERAISLPDSPQGHPADSPAGDALSDDSPPVEVGEHVDPLEALLGALEAAGERGIRAEDLAAQTGMSRAWVFTRLGELERGGQVTRSARLTGHWQLIQGGGGCDRAE